MNKDFVTSWDKNKKGLENYFQNTNQSEYKSYEALVKIVVNNIINPDLDEYDSFDTERIHTIDDGDYQGTQVFIMPKNEYQPSIYLVTMQHYGSCSWCDTLQGIHNYDDELPTKDQIKCYMSLSLHLIQQMKILNYEY